MTFKTILPIICLLICVFSMASVCASEANDTAMASGDTDFKLSADNEMDADNLQTSEENTTLTQANDDETVGAESDSQTLSEGEGTYYDLRNEIGSGGNKSLTKSLYSYTGGDTIQITTSGVINGNGAIIDMTGSTIRAFTVSASGVTIKNLTIKNANYNGNGGAIYFNGKGTVSNCNFTDNKATGDENWGGAIYMSSGTVTNCNFTNNKATGNYGFGGAICMSSGTVTNCNFDGSEATTDGGAIWMDSGSVTNCNFTNNIASSCGGAVFILSNGNVTNCNFTNNAAPYGDGGAIWRSSGNVTNCNFDGNEAGYRGGAIYFSQASSAINCNFANNHNNEGGAIYSYGRYTAADTCIFKTESDTTNDNVIIVSPTLNADNSTIYKSGEKLTFNLTTDRGMPVNNGNISISVHYKNNNSWFGNYSCLSGEGWTVGLPVGSYYAIFDTEYAGFNVINRTIKVIPNIPYYANITSISTNNKTVNITAKSNIPQDIVEGKLLFILPNGDEINATYAADGIWWAVHTFDDYAVYQVNASYEGLNNVTVSNAKITINKVDSTITLDNITLNYGESRNVTVVTQGATGITADINGTNATVINNYTIQIADLAAGNYTLTVTTIPDGDHVSVNKTVKITVNKINSTLTLNNIIFDYNGTGSTVVSYDGATGVNASVVGQSDAIVNVDGNTIAVSGLDVGNYTLTVTAIADANHNNVTKNVTVTVNKIKTVLEADAITATYNVNKDLVITLKDAQGKVLSGVNVIVNLNGAKLYTTDANGQVKVSTKGLAPKSYTAKISFNGNANYDKSSKDVKVTVKKAKAKITAKNKTFKKSKKVKKYSITLKDNAGKPIKKAKVTLKVKGKTYKAKTNSKGKATFKIKKLNKKGTFKAVIKYKGNKYYKKVTQKSKIKVIVTFKTVSKGSKDKSTVKDIQQALKDHGYYLTYKGQYLKIDGIYHGHTERSVKEFQHDKGLKVTGSVDEKTAKKLGII